MDAYLASGDYRETSSLFFNLNFEVLKGCQFSCKGCAVNKQEAQVLAADDKEKLIRLLDSVNDDGIYKCFIAFIGPTDFLTADNTLDVLTDPDFIDVLSRFKRLSFQTTCLNVKRAEDFARVMHEHYPHHELEINFLVEPEKINNAKYIATLEKNKKYLYEKLNWSTPIRSFAIMNLYSLDLVKKEANKGFMSDYTKMHAMVEDLFETTIDFNFSFARKKDASRLEFLEACERMKQLFNEGVNRYTVEFIRFSFGKLKDSLVEYQYNYLNGKLYFSPLLYERFVSFFDDLNLKLVDYDIREIESRERDLQLEQYDYAEQSAECMDCQYLKSCCDRGILKLMKIYQTKDCVVAKGALNTVNDPSAVQTVSKKKNYFIPIEVA